MLVDRSQARPVVWLVQGLAAQWADRIVLMHGGHTHASGRPDEVLTPALLAQVYGVTARVELDGVNGSTGQHFEVEITRERAQELHLADGQQVRLVPSRLKVFEREGAGA